MAIGIYGRFAGNDNPNPYFESGLSPAHPELVGNALISPDEQVAIMALLDDQGGEAALGDCTTALQDHPRPVAALVALAEAGLVAFAVEDAFDPNCRVRRRLAIR